eukprot:6191935-Pleurochrysis_carterae.AAC.1
MAFDEESSVLRLGEQAVPSRRFSKNAWKKTTKNETLAHNESAGFLRVGLKNGRGCKARSDSSS